ncbi:DUF4238 domain-containing protein [Rhizobium leguminosarum]|uniref:DUF4238 domain-containing protein n=1 Tax=Rhizobium leguminosarum TaxID=384 RepID=UPI0016174E82|nr:DUF4238 domain-containing protein [Rhizobium leguminosarum]MBB4339532.1 hypothetical protein [Rhizobium leguminosarum]MBB6291757.1 hypothetical protein [Rhizobium leguminosarum]
MKHHYIPQFYLKQWEGPDQKLQVYLRRGDGLIITKRLARKATGYEVDLYKLSGATPEREHEVERLFMALVDDEAVRVRDGMLASILPKEQQKRFAWARFVLSLVIRNPDELKTFKADYAKHLLMPAPEFQARYAAVRQEGDPELFEDWIVKTDPSYAERQAVVTLTRLIENHSVLRLLRTMHWRIIDTSRSSRRLMTSDRPVMMTKGMVQYKGHYALPVSPTRLFLATTTVQFADEFCALPVGKIVREANRLLIGQARKFVYALDDRSLAEVRRGFSKLEAPSLVPSMKPKHGR